MTKSTKSKPETQSKNALINLVSALLPGKHNTVPISTLVLWALGRDYEAAAMFTQCMYWKDRTDDEDGWFYKSYEDWYEEILIEEACARRKVKKLESMGWIQTMVWQVHRTPKLHYRVLMEQVVEDLTHAAESCAEDRRVRDEKKEQDLAKRRDRNREKRAETLDTTGYLQNGGNVSDQNGGIQTSNMAGSIDTKTTIKNYIPEITSKYTKSVSGEHAVIGESNFETGITKGQTGSKHGGLASTQSHPDSCGGGETHETQNETDPYAKPWNSGSPFRVDEDGWAVLPQFPKHKMANFIATRSLQLELLAEMDEDFTMEWKPEYGRQCWIATSRGEAGFEDAILGTRKSTGMGEDDYSIEYNDEDESYCVPGATSLRLLRNWGYERGAIDQEYYNSRLKELWNVAKEFLDQEDAMDIYATSPIYEYMDLDGIEMN
jgi:hypothetical protein